MCHPPDDVTRVGLITRVVRSAALDALAQDFVLALDAKGLWRRTVFAHVVKNSAPQILTVLGLQFGFQLGGRCWSRRCSPGRAPGIS
jgi:ABC-type dipeptide/oligopeptide/nickel transport system permease component